MDFGSAFTFVTQDEDWIKKLLIATGILLVGGWFFGIGVIIVSGWAAEIMRRVANDGDQSLPEWDDFGKYFMDGLKLAVIQFVWFLPAGLIFGCLFALVAGAGIALGDTDAGATIAIILTVCAYGFLFLYAIVVSLVLPAAAAVFVDTGSIGDALKPAKVFSIFRANLGGFIITAIVGSIVVSLASSLGVILCGIGTFLGMAYGLAVNGHLIGQTYKSAKAALPAG